MKLEKYDQKMLALWAADCAEHVLPYFEKEYPNDDRPRKAINACRAWSQTGIFTMAVIRRASLGAHAAARDAKKDNPARFAARAAGQAVATAHVAEHAVGAAWYARKAAFAAQADASGEKEWQEERIPPKTRSWITTTYSRKYKSKK